MCYTWIKKKKFWNNYASSKGYKSKIKFASSWPSKAADPKGSPKILQQDDNMWSWPKTNLFRPTYDFLLVSSKYLRQSSASQSFRAQELPAHITCRMKILYWWSH